MKNAKAFTLIELLIVIALLGALAIGLLATIDPFEQLKKGRDTATRNSVTEFYNASLRYYGTKGEFPWGTSTNLDARLSNIGPAIAELVQAGELKAQFQTAQGDRLQKINVYSTDPNDNMVICFSPESKNFRLDANTIYNSTGGDEVGCGAGTSSQCWWCIK